MHVLDRLRQLRGEQATSPRPLFLLAVQQVSKIERFERRKRVLRRRPGLTKDIRRTNDGVLDVRSSLALEAERILEVEGYDRIPRVAQHASERSAPTPIWRAIVARSSSGRSA